MPESFTSENAPEVNRWTHYYEGPLLGAHGEIAMEDSPKAPDEMPELLDTGNGILAYVRSEPYVRPLDDSDIVEGSEFDGPVWTGGGRR